MMWCVLSMSSWWFFRLIIITMSNIKLKLITNRLVLTSLCAGTQRWAEPCSGCCSWSRPWPHTVISCLLPGLLFDFVLSGRALVQSCHWKEGEKTITGLVYPPTNTTTWTWSEIGWCGQVIRDSQHPRLVEKPPPTRRIPRGRPI